ncbi:CpaF family protein [Candidatus Micrarchaeota archaeon]|nr:CpaF family protein [Candidatus Micrarchaeota archaeon]
MQHSIERMGEEEKERKVLTELAGKLSMTQTKEDQRKIISYVINQVYPDLSPREKNSLIDKFLRFGQFEDLMEDSDIEDILINSINSVFVFHAKKGMIKTNKTFKDVEDLNIFAEKLLVVSGKTEFKPVNNFHLPDGSRVNIVSSPTGPQITIRKFKHRTLSIIDLIKSGTLDYFLAAQLWVYSEGLGIKPANLLIGGMPGSGKTTLLNALFSFFPTNERTVVIEDTLELNTKSKENCSRLECNPELSMRDLVKNTLRMRPDRIIVGEVRGEEAMDLMTAMNIGKICMGTLHASTSREAVMRLQNEPMNIPQESVPLIDVFVIIRHFLLPSGVFRTVSQVSEVGGIEKKVLLSDLCIFDPKSGKMAESHPSVIYRDKLAEAAGITPKEIMDEINLRSKILKTLEKNNITTIEAISEFCAKYYENPNKALTSIGLPM